MDRIACDPARQDFDTFGIAESQVKPRYAEGRKTLLGTQNPCICFAGASI